MKSIITESAPRGMIVVATKNYLPGQLILEEKPLMVVPKEYIEGFEIFDVPYDVMWANYSWFTNKLKAEEQAKILAMFVPASCKEADRLQEMAGQIVLSAPNGARRSLSLSEIDVLVKLTRIMKRNTFPMRGDQILYSEMSHFAHSCAGNCHFLIELGQTNIRCSAIKPISAGEELTFSYLPIHDMQFTHQRRRHYLDTYEFACHCPRCDAPGDDTRQLSCPNIVCNGVVVVCQPINNDKIFLAGLQYEGVEYVEPHLLPCTVCHRVILAASHEKKLPTTVQTLTETEQMLFMAWNAPHYQTLLEDCTRLVLPHSLFLSIHTVLLRIARFQFMHRVRNRAIEPQLAVYRARVHHAAHAYISAQEKIFRSSYLVEVLYAVCYECIFIPHRMRLPRIYLPLHAKVLLQKTLRTQLMFLGRAGGRMHGLCDELHEHLRWALEKLPVRADMNLCAFCEESPQRVAVTLSRCGKCKQVCYCSAGCQKAHWKLHKKTCKAAGTSVVA